MSRRRNWGVKTLGTINLGRNREKHSARAVEVILRAEIVDRRAAGDFTITGAKFHRGHLMINMLANRRLRQRGLRA